MIRVQDVRGGSGDDPIIWEVLAERFHASQIERQHHELRASEAAALGEGLEAFKAATVDAVTAWARGDDAPLQADGSTSGSGDDEASGGDSGDVGTAGRASASADASPLSAGKRRKREPEPVAAAGETETGAGHEA